MNEKQWIFIELILHQHFGHLATYWCSERLVNLIGFIKWPQTDWIRNHSYLILKLTQAFRKQYLFSVTSQSRRFWSQITKVTGFFLKKRIEIPYYLQVLKKAMPLFLWIPHSKIPVSDAILLFFSNWIQVPLCHRITGHQQTAFSTLSMQTYQQRMRKSSRSSMATNDWEGLQSGHQSSKHSLRTHQSLALNLLVIRNTELKSRSPPVLVYSGCFNKIPQTVWFIQYKFLIVWRLEVWDQGA